MVAVAKNLEVRVSHSASINRIFAAINRTPSGRAAARRFQKAHGSGNVILDMVDRGALEIVGRRRDYYRTNVECQAIRPRSGYQNIRSK